MILRIAFVWSLSILATGCEEKPKSAEEIRHFKELHDRPAEIDTSVVESFEIEIDGENGFTGDPKVIAGEPFSFLGRLELKEGVLTEWITGSLRVGYRKIENGVADWSITKKGYYEFIIESLMLNEGEERWNVDRAIKKNRLKPGLYELRYYLLLKKFNPYGTDEFTGIYFLNSGQLEILPSIETE